VHWCIDEYALQEQADISNHAEGDRTKNKPLVAAGEGHGDYVLQDPTGLDIKLRITDVSRLRKFIALAGLRHALKPNGKRTSLVNYMRNRFSKGMCEADVALQDVEPLQQDPTEVQIVSKWAEIITKGGMLPSLCVLLHFHASRLFDSHCGGSEQW
jgi:hypothetical protein